MADNKSYQGEDEEEETERETLNSKNGEGNLMSLIYNFMSFYCFLTL